MDEHKRRDQSRRDRRPARLGGFGEIFTPLVLLIIFLGVLGVLYFVAL